MNRISRNHKVYNISYHIIWIPKYRKRILNGNLKDDLTLLIQQKCTQLGISLEAYEIMPDHIHIFIKAHPNISVSDIIKQIKGYTSYNLRKKYKWLRKYKSLWTPSYFCETIGLISEQTVRRYIDMQRI